MSATLIFAGRSLTFTKETIPTDLAQTLKDMLDKKAGNPITDVDVFYGTMSPEQKNDIAMLVIKGLQTPQRVGSTYGIDSRVVKKCVLSVDPNLKHTHTRSKVTPELVEKIKAAVTERDEAIAKKGKKKTLIEIAQELGISTTEIYMVQKPKPIKKKIVAEDPLANGQGSSVTRKGVDLASDVPKIEIVNSP
jgi:hypothetical protein